MIGYTVRRLGQTVVTLFILSIIFFLFVRFQPGGGACVGSQLGCNEILRLDQPVATQYILWLGALFHGNFGTNGYGQDVGTNILQDLPPTLLLVAVSLVLQQFIALSLGILSAVRQYSRLDQGLTFGSYVALSIPSFVLGAALLHVFAVVWPVLPVDRPESNILPIFGTHDWFTLLWNNPALALGDLVRHLILPVFVLTAGGIAIDSRFMRAALLQVLHEEYIRTARAGGISRWRIILKFALRNALLPIITNLGLYLPALLGGVVVVETLFDWGGLGWLMGQSLGDFPTLEALVMLSAVAVVLANLLADLTYAWLDPRIRFESTGT